MEGKFVIFQCAFLWYIMKNEEVKKQSGENLVFISKGKMIQRHNLTVKFEVRKIH